MTSVQLGTRQPIMLSVGIGLYNLQIPEALFLQDFILQWNVFDQVTSDRNN